MTLEAVRKRIDAVDARLLRLLNARARLAGQVAAEKCRAGRPVRDLEREQEVLDRVRRLNGGPLGRAALEAIYGRIMAACVDLQEQAAPRARTAPGFQDLANPWIPGLATYERGRPIEEVARELGIRPAAIVKLASNENALGPAPAAERALRRCARDLHRYPDGSAYRLRQALAGHLGVQPGELLPANGSNEIIQLLVHVFLGPDHGMVMADGAFVIYRLVAESYGVPVTRVPMRRYTHDLDAMLAAIRPDTRLVFVANPDNPTSTMVSPRALERFIRAVPDHVVVCVDEAYIDLVEPARRPDTLRFVREGRKVVVLRSFSKAYGMAGLRIGYAVAPEPCIELLNRVRQPFHVNALALEAAVAVLGDPAFLRRSRRMVRDGIAYLTAAFRRLGLAIVPPAANFMLVDVGRGREVFQALLKQGVIVRPMDGYGLPRHVRVSVGTRRENEACVRALRAVGAPRIARAARRAGGGVP